MNVPADKATPVAQRSGLAPRPSTLRVGAAPDVTWGMRVMDFLSISARLLKFWLLNAA